MPGVGKYPSLYTNVPREKKQMSGDGRKDVHEPWSKVQRPITKQREPRGVVSSREISPALVITRWMKSGFRVRFKIVAEVPPQILRY